MDYHTFPMRGLVNYEGCWGSLKRRKWNQWFQKLRTSDKVQWSAIPCKCEAKWRAKKIKSSLTIFRVSYPQKRLNHLNQKDRKTHPKFYIIRVMITILWDVYSNGSLILRKKIGKTDYFICYVRVDCRNATFFIPR